MKIMKTMKDMKEHGTPERRRSDAAEGGLAIAGGRRSGVFMLFIRFTAFMPAKQVL